LAAASAFAFASAAAFAIASAAALKCPNESVIQTFILQCVTRTRHFQTRRSVFLVSSVTLGFQGVKLSSRRT
jgi:hypothetical protein